MRIFARIIAIGLRAFFVAVVMAVVFAAAAAGLSFLVVTQGVHQGSLSTMDYVVGGVITLLTGYAAATTVLLRAVVRETRDVVGAGEDIVEGAVTPKKQLVR